MRFGDGYWVDDFYVCPDCYERETAICEDCEERHFIENMKYEKPDCDKLRNIFSE